MSSEFHVAPDGKLYLTDVHDLKAFNGTTDFCIEYATGGEDKPKCENGTTKYPDHGKMSELDGKCKLSQRWNYSFIST